MIVDVGCPQQRARLGIDAVHIGASIAEEHGLAAPSRRGSIRRHIGRGAHAGLGLERPVRAAGDRIERMHFAIFAGHEQAATGHRGLRARGADIGVAEGPLELQSWKVSGGDATALRIGEAIDRLLGGV